jgi:hypothetical protein
MVVFFCVWIEYSSLTCKPIHISMHPSRFCAHLLFCCVFRYGNDWDSSSARVLDELGLDRIHYEVLACVSLCYIALCIDFYSLLSVVCVARPQEDGERLGKFKHKRSYFC